MVWVVQKLLFYLGFPQNHLMGLDRMAQKQEVSSPLGKTVLLMSKVRGDWPELIGMQQVTSLNAQYIKPWSRCAMTAEDHTTGILISRRVHCRVDFYQLCNEESLILAKILQYFLTPTQWQLSLLSKTRKEDFQFQLFHQVCHARGDFQRNRRG